MNPIDVDPHDWGPFEAIRDAAFGVTMGSKETCRRCGAVRYEDWCETRASGGTPRVVEPGDGSCLLPRKGDGS